MDVRGLIGRVGMGMLLAAAWLAGWSARGADAEARWPQFRGPGGQGVGGDGQRLPAAFGPRRHVVWKAELPRGHSSPCVWDDRIYLTGYDSTARNLLTLCLDRGSGKVRWQKAAPAQAIESVHPLNTPASSTPATDGEQVYVYFASYGLLCYGKDGDLRWERPLEPVPTPFGSGTSPVVAGGRVLVQVGAGRFAFSLLALDSRTGKTIWKKDRPRGFSTGLWSTPLVRPVEGGHEVVVAGGTHVVAYSLAYGAVRWRVGGLPTISLSSPAWGDGRLYLTLTNPVGDPTENVARLPSFDELLKKYDRNKDGKLSADELPDDLVLFDRGRADKLGNFGRVRDAVARYDQNGDKALDRAEWQAMVEGVARSTSGLEVAVAAVQPGGAGQARVVWKQTRAVPEVPSPLYYRGRLYLVSDRGIVTCRDPALGKEVYRERLGGRGACYASPVAADGKVYAGSDGGVLVVFRAGERFEVLARNDLGEGIVATPALVDGKVYVRTERHLCAFGE